MKPLIRNIVETPPYAVVKPDVTAEQFFEMADETTHCELIGGMFIVHSPATVDHERRFGFLFRVTAGYAEEKGLGEVLGSRVAIRLGPEDVFEPEVLFISKKRAGRIRKKKIEGAPDFVIEVVSPSSRTTDMGWRRRAYLAAGVREYWVVDREKGEIRVFRPDESEDGTAYRAGRIDCSALPGFWIDAAWVLSDPLPLVARCLRQILGSRSV